MSAIWGAIYQATYGAYKEWQDGRRRKAEAKRSEAILDQAMAKAEADKAQAAPEK